MLLTVKALDRNKNRAIWLTTYFRGGNLALFSQSGLDLTPCPMCG